mmetsp:Transcript_34030/g.78531  ORF Transcript_34030/g.78531 Transcript_34030/m.78531 type:complete len:729 (-) Transcript_34030:402-2588(-)
MKRVKMSCNIATDQANNSFILSIICGDNNLHWAFHKGMAQTPAETSDELRSNASQALADNKREDAENCDEKSYLPVLFWRTPKVRADLLAAIQVSQSDERNSNKDSDELKEKCMEILSCHLAKHVHEYLFGEGEKRYETIPVYVVSNDEEQNRLLQSMWQGVDCEVKILKADDFFTKKEGLIDSMEIERLAALRGAAFLHGVPTLVFDSGHKLSYAATDDNGHIIGGGTGPGIDMKLSAINGDKSTPLNQKDVLEYVLKYAKEKSILKTFAKNANDEIMVDVLGDIHSKGRRVISQWIRTTEQSSSVTNFPKRGKSNNDRKVVVTGSDGVQVLVELLASDLIIDAEFDGISNPLYRIVHQKYLHHYGVTGILYKNEKQRILESRKSTPNQVKVLTEVVSEEKIVTNGINKVSPYEEKKNDVNTNTLYQDDKNQVDDDDDDEEVIGQRVAQWFSLDTGGREVFIGTVVGIQRDEGAAWYLIKYDDGDRENVNFTSLQEMFKLYKNHGVKLDKNRKISDAKVHNDISRTNELDQKGIKNKTTDSMKEKKKKKSDGVHAKSLKRKNEDIDGSVSPVSRSVEYESNTHGTKQKQPDFLKDRKKRKSDGWKRTDEKASAAHNMRQTAGLSERRKQQPPVRFTPLHNHHSKNKKEKKSDTENKHLTDEKLGKMQHKVPKSETYLNRRVANYFDGDVYFGTITKCYRDDQMWHVRYDDGDREDYTYPELKELFKL